MSDFIIPPSPAVAIVDRTVQRYVFTPDPEDETLFRSYLGTPVWSPLEFMKTSGTSLDNSRGVGEANGNSQVLLRIDTVLHQVNQPKNIVKTPIAGRDGTVKEYISDGDYMLDIRGEIISQFPLVYPKDDVKIFIELMRLKKQIPIASDFLQLFGIDAIVVEDWGIAEKLGSRNEVPFYITAVSDMAEEIILNPIKSL
jgi:hypothetical protein